MPYRNGTIVHNVITWTDDMTQFLKDNFWELTNQQLATALNLRLTKTRNKCRELGLKRIDMEYWTTEQIDFLISNYKIKGDVEIAEIFQIKFPKNKRWTKNHINKKRRYLKINRTIEEIKTIASINSKPGGNSFTIIKNSSSLNMHPTWIAQRIAWRDPELQQEILKNHPELISISKEILLLNRMIKNKKHNINEKQK